MIQHDDGVTTVPLSPLGQKLMADSAGAERDTYCETYEKIAHLAGHKLREPLTKDEFTIYQDLVDATAVAKSLVQNFWYVQHGGSSR